MLCSVGRVTSSSRKNWIRCLVGPQVFAFSTPCALILRRIWRGGKRLIPECLVWQTCLWQRTVLNINWYICFDIRFYPVCIKHKFPVAQGGNVWWNSQRTGCQYIGYSQPIERSASVAGSLWAFQMFMLSLRYFHEKKIDFLSILIHFFF